MPSPSCPISNKPIYEGAQREYCTPSCDTYSYQRDEDEERLIFEGAFGEERQSEVDEDEIFGELRHETECEFGGKLGSPGHVVIGVMLEADATEQQCHNS